MNASTLLIRADANIAMGTGHVMRCLALAQSWQDNGGVCIFAMAESTPAVESRLREQGMEIEFLGVPPGSNEDARMTASVAARNNAKWIVLDGYQFSSTYQSAIKQGGLKLLVLDDFVHAAPYTADLILNQNFHARPELYTRRDPSTQLILGPRYAMLRREFRTWRGWRRDNPSSAKKILVTMGGSDPDNITCLVIDAIKNIENQNVETTVLVGGSNPHLGSIERLIGTRFRLVVDPSNVAEWIMWADVAISGAGTTVWELCFLGLPSILLVLAANQEAVANFAEKARIVRNLGKASDVTSTIISEKVRELLDSAAEREIQSRNGRRLVDGRGAERVVAHLSDLHLRSATDADCELYWEWANDSDARAASFRNKIISWEHHAQWFKSKLEDSNAVLYAAINPAATNGSSTPMGQVRFQMEGDRAVLSISLGSAYRGQGWGQKILTLAVEKFLRERETDFIDAFVKPANAASLRLFEKAGFERLASAAIEGQEAVHFVLQRNASPEAI